MTRFATSNTEVVTAVLQGYADRGVFRGFSAMPSARGCEYRFSWLTRRPMVVGFKAASNVLRFSRLFPDVQSYAGLPGDLRALVAGRSARDVPAHKRLDRRRATMTASIKDGHWSLAAAVRGSNHEYATRMALNLVN